VSTKSERFDVWISQRSPRFRGLFGAATKSRQTQPNPHGVGAGAFRPRGALRVSPPSARYIAAARQVCSSGAGARQGGRAHSEVCLLNQPVLGGATCAGARERVRTSRTAHCGPELVTPVEGGKRATVYRACAPGQIPVYATSRSSCSYSNRLKPSCTWRRCTGIRGVRGPVTSVSGGDPVSSSAI